MEDYAHDGLTGTNGTVYFGVNFINAHRITYSYEGIKDILTEFLSLNDYLLAFGVDVWIKDCQSIDSVSLLSDTRSDGSWV